MARLFLDTSALIKLYHAEPNSPLVKSCVSPADELVIAQVTQLEFRSAFYGLVRQGALLLTDASRRIADFEQDLPGYGTVPASEEVFGLAEDLLREWAVSVGLRPLDALQLASALAAHGHAPLDALVTTDKVLASTARSSGLEVLP